MSGQVILPDLSGEHAAQQTEVAAKRRQRRTGSVLGPLSFRVPEYQEQSVALHHAELFYLQKQIQSQTQMVIVMEDGETIEGCIEWYDRHTLKVRGRSRMLIFKSAIKYMYKHGENGI